MLLMLQKEHPREATRWPSSPLSLSELEFRCFRAVCCSRTTLSRARLEFHLFTEHVQYFLDSFLIFAFEFTAN